MNTRQRNAIERAMDESVERVHHGGTDDASTNDLILAGFATVIEKMEEIKQAACMQRKTKSQVITIGAISIPFAAIVVLAELAKELLS